MLNNFIKIYGKNIKQVYFTTLILIMLFYLFFANESYLKKVIFLGYDIIFLLIGWGVMWIVLGFQNINPFCSKKAFSSSCNFFIFGSIFGFVLFLKDLIISREERSMWLLFAICGSLAAAYYLKVKYILTESISSDIADKTE